MHSMESHSGRESSTDDYNRYIDVLKGNLRAGEWDPKKQKFMSQEETIHKYEQEKIIDRPKLTRRIGRKILDLLNIYSVSSEIRRRREAMTIALNEYIEESAEEILKDTEQDLSNSVKSIMERDKQEEQKKRQEAKDLLFDMSTGHDSSNYNKQKFYMNMAKQEKLEREFNDNLTPIKDLELYANANDPRVQKDTIKFEDKKITIYKLKGFPLKFLGHVINYNEKNRINPGGTEMFNRLLIDPNLWYKTPDDFQNGNGRDLDLYQATMANTLSTSYVDLTAGIDSFDHLPLPKSRCRITYLFDHIRPTSLLYAKHADGATPQRINQTNAYRDEAIAKMLGSVNSIEDLNKDNATDCLYNEVAMFRYDENGNPLPPKAMITDLDDLTTQVDDLFDFDGGIIYKNAIKKHAAAHNIPIIQIDRNSYSKTPIETSHETTSISQNNEDINQTIEHDKKWNLTKVSHRLGSNEGGWYKNTNGERFYVKFYKNPSQGQVEFITNSIYNKLGIKAVHSKIIQLDGHEAIASPAIPKAAYVSQEIQSKSEDVQKGFVADAFLANWDVIGAAYENIVQGEDGLYRIDNGGSLIFRARGGDKDYSPNSIPELQSMRTFGRPTGAVFANITEDEIKKQVHELVNNLSSEDIKTIVNESGLKGKDRDRVLTGLLGRREYLIKTYKIPQ